MKLSLPKYYNRRIARAIAEFDLIEEGDNILVGFSGGKDSGFLLYALKAFQQSMSINFNISAITIDLEFNKDADFSQMKGYCKSLDIPYQIVKSNISKIILAEETKNPCAKCAYFRKGIISNYMQEKGFNKVAYGHHYDDIVETFLMSIIYSGQIKTFQAKSYLSNSDIYVIRPLLYLREENIIKAEEFTGYKAVKSSCPYDGETKREEIKNLIKSFDHKNQIFYNLAAAMREGTPINLLPKELSRDKIRDKMKKLWY
ncbi:tRNA 2-thiocytidine biosynthesis TtcA family protein [Halonatronum saccharophilum]|uniref:tRNA 2-thiocytidine biosynthesis TtcA family protein n=1 Tax=Halonatronum saccharophilum TaxID=150060 RepID=UPI000480B1E6|nr:ATP-binding protein [Halonatronum saccharophilum]